MCNDHTHLFKQFVNARFKISCCGEITVASHGSYGRDASESLQNFGATDIPSVQNEVNTAQRAEHFRSHEAVGI